MLAIRLGGATGDITGTDHIAWSKTRSTPYVPSPILLNGWLYYLRHYQGILSRANAKTGSEPSGPFRLGPIFNVYSSPVGVKGRIYITDRNGKTIVISDGQEPSALALNELSDKISKQIQNGMTITYSKYRDALTLANRCREELNEIFGDCDFILAPSATGEAPKGLEYTGDPQFQGCWTILHVPTISLPTHTGPNDLPVGIQLVGRRWQDEKLLSWSRWVMKQLKNQA